VQRSFFALLELRLLFHFSRFRRPEAYSERFPLINERKRPEKNPLRASRGAATATKGTCGADHMPDHIKTGMWSALEKKSPHLSRDFLRSDRMTRRPDEIRQTLFLYAYQIALSHSFKKVPNYMVIWSGIA